MKTIKSKVILVCKTCNKKFSVFPCCIRAAKNRNSTVQYCSMVCYNKNGSKNPKWRGGSILVGGYVYKYIPEHPNATKDGYVCEHRLVMENHLGRLLDYKEVVHHKNHDIKDNRLENLELISSGGTHFINYHLAGRDKLGRFAITK